MKNSEFNEEAARKFLRQKERKTLSENEKLRLDILTQTKEILIESLQNEGIEVWLIGSIILPNGFTKRSDIDIVVKNYIGDRFELWSLLERKINHEVEIIRYEECTFQEDVVKRGLKVL